MGNGVEGHNMTSIEDGGSDGTETAPDPKNHGSVTEPADAAGADGGREDRAARGDGGPQEGEVPGEGEEPAPEPQVDENGNPIEGEVGGDAPEPFNADAFKEDILKSIEEKMKPPAQPAQLTEEQWAQKEQEFGASRQTIQAFTNQSMKVYNAVVDMMESRFAKFEKAEALQGLSREKGYEDALRYPKGIEQFLSKYNPKHHSNPELLRMAVVYARGLASSKNIQRVRTEVERNRRIAGPARPSSPGNSGAGRKPGGAPVALNRSQREVADKFGMSETEYRNELNKRGKPIAI